MELTLNEVAEKRGITTSAVHYSIVKGKLKATKKNGRWVVKLSDVLKYEKNLYKHEFSLLKGKPVFDKNKGFYSVKEASEILGCNRQLIYYALRKEKIRYHHRHNKVTWVIHKHDIDEFKKEMKSFPRKYRKIN